MIRLTGFACLLLLLSAIPTLADEPKDEATMAGTWLPESAELGGEKLPDELRKSIKLVIKDGKYTLTLGQSPPDHGSLKLDAAAKPKTMDIVGTEGPNKGKTILCIYKLEKDTLTICYELGGKDRPKEFKSPQGTRLFLVMYSREKASSRN